jgi:hypothetical protein
MQKFDFDYFKPSIIRHTETILNDKAKNYDILSRSAQKQLENIFYNIIRNNTTSRIDNYKQLRFEKWQYDNWKKYFTSNAWNVSGLWSQRSFNPLLPRKTGKDKTYNYYITLDKTKDNISKFLAFVPRLDRELKTLSDLEQSPISYKVHNNLDYIISDNDSAKVYYYDPFLKDKIEKVVKDWSISNKINLSPRTHYHGLDVRFKPEDDKNSFGEIASKKIAELFVDAIKKYGNKHTPDKYYEWIKSHFTKLLSTIKF